MASEQASRDATMAPAAFANRIDPLEVPAGQQPVAQRPAERVTGAEAVDDLDRHRRHLDRLVPVVREHALGALLDDRQADAELVQRPRRR